MIPKALAIAGSIALATPALAGGVSGVPTFTHTGVNNFCFQLDNKPKLYGVPLVAPQGADPNDIDPDMAGAIDRAFSVGDRIAFEFFDSDNVNCNVGGVKVGARVRAIDKGNMAR